MLGWGGDSALWAVAALTAAAAWTDWRWRRVPHWMLAASLAVWVVTAMLVPAAIGGAPLASLICGGICLVIGFGIYSAGWFGAGDGKLLGVLGLWLGPKDLGFALLAGSALLFLAWLAAVAGPEDGSFRRRGIPVACALAPPAAVLLAVRAVGLSG